MNGGLRPPTISLDAEVGNDSHDAYDILQVQSSASEAVAPLFCSECFQSLLSGAKQRCLLLQRGRCSDSTGR